MLKKIWRAKSFARKFKNAFFKEIKIGGKNKRTLGFFPSQPRPHFHHQFSFFFSLPQFPSLPTSLSLSRLFFPISFSSKSFLASFLGFFSVFWMVGKIFHFCSVFVASYVFILWVLDGFAWREFVIFCWVWTGFSLLVLGDVLKLCLYDFFFLSFFWCSCRGS